MKRSIQKKWNLDKFLEEASQREDINQQVRDMKEDFKISKIEHHDQSRDSPKNGKWDGRRKSKKPPRPPPGNTRKKRKTNVVATVGKQEHTPQAEIAWHMGNSA